MSIYIKNFVTKLYPTLTHFKVGALRSRGVYSQCHLQGLLHRDYKEHVNKKVPNECLQSIIVALDTFNLLYEYYEYDETKEESATVLTVKVVKPSFFPAHFGMRVDATPTTMKTLDTNIVSLLTLHPKTKTFQGKAPD